jgi:hypothetical protein
MAKGDLEVVKETLKWHAIIGGAAISAVVAVAFLFVQWYLPKELESSSKHTSDAIQIKLDVIAKLQIDKVSAQLDDARRSGQRIPDHYLTSSISPGFHVLSNHGWSGP